MSSPIVNGTNIDTSLFSYSAPKPNPSGGKVVNFYNKNAKESFTIAVPMMPSWGAQETMEIKGKDGSGQPIKVPTGKYTMTLQFPTGQYATPETEAFLEQMKKLENQIKLDAMANSKEWFGKEIKSMDVMDEKFTPMLKYPKISKDSEERDYSKPPSLSLKLPCWKGVWQTSVFDEDRNPLYVKGESSAELSPLDFLKTSGKAPIQTICLIQCAGIWFVGSPAKLSITWNLKQVIVKKPKTSAISDNVCFLTMNPADAERMKQIPEPEFPDVTAGDHVATLVADSDDEREMPNVVPSAAPQAPTRPAPAAPVVVEESATTEEITEKPKPKIIRKKKADA